MGRINRRENRQTNLYKLVFLITIVNTVILLVQYNIYPLPFEMQESASYLNKAQASSVNNRILYITMMMFFKVA